MGGRGQQGVGMERIFDDNNRAYLSPGQYGAREQRNEIVDA